jgi:PAS domain-containing protein
MAVASRRWSQSLLLRDAQDDIIGYLLIGTDNTARKQAEAALLKAGALQSAIFNSANFSSNGVRLLHRYANNNGLNWAS